MQPEQVSTSHGQGTVSNTPAAFFCILPTAEPGWLQWGHLGSFSQAVRRI